MAIVLGLDLSTQSATALAGIIVRIFADDVEGPLRMMNREPKP